MGEVVTNEPLTPAAVGAEIARLRMQVGWTTEQLAHELKIAPRQLTLLEKGEWEQLPSPLFVRGVLKQLGSWSGCDIKPWLAAVDAAFPPAAVRLIPPSNADGEILSRQPFWLRRSVQLVALVGGVALLLWAYLNWFGVIGNREEPPLVPRLGLVSPSEPQEGDVLAPLPAAAGEQHEVPSRSNEQGQNGVALAEPLAERGGAAAPSQSVSGGQTTETPSAAAQVVAEQQRSSEAMGPSSGLLVRVKGGESWLRVSGADGRVRYEGVLRDGQERRFPTDGAPYVLHLGNAQVVTLWWHGEVVPLTSKGVVRLQVPLQTPQRGEQRDG